MATHLVQQRALSEADAVNALRPFYFAVHPDFFGQHPRERVGLLFILDQFINSYKCYIGNQTNLM